LRILAAVATLLVLAAGQARADARSVDLWLGGRETTVDIFLPPPGTSTPACDAVILAHGFTRSRASMTGHAARLAREGLVVAVPDLPYFWHSGDNAAALRDLVAALSRGTFTPPAARVVLVGFSAGGLAALLAADAPGVVGYVGLDPFDRPSGIGLAAAKKLQLPAYLLRASASACNAYSIAEPWRTAFPKLVMDRVVPGATHCDFEWPTDWLCRAACGGTDDARRKEIGDALVDAVRALLASGLPSAQTPTAGTGS
jgi:dienelactone hydrolase